MTVNTAHHPAHATQSVDRCAMCGRGPDSLTGASQLQIVAGRGDDVALEYFCSWRCLRDYADERVIHDAARLPSEASEARYLTDWAM